MMIDTIQTAETDQEKHARETLEASLEPGETLLGYILGKSSRGWFDTTQRFFIGLTYRRFVIVPMNRNRHVYTIDLQFIKSVSYTSKRMNGRRGLILELDKDSLSFRTYGPFEQRALRIVEQYNQLNIEPNQPPLTQVVRQAKELLDFGYLPAVQKLLGSRMMRDPIASTNLEAVGLFDEIKEHKLALRAGAIIFLIVALHMVFLAVQGSARFGAGFILSLIAIAGLLRGQNAWRTTALSLAGLTAGLNLFINLMAKTKSPMDIIMWVAFGLAMTLILTGKPNRIRTLAGSAVFVFGFIGVIALIVIRALLPTSLVSVLPAFPGTQFSDDFSMKLGWLHNDAVGFTATVTDGSYDIFVRDREAMFIAAPPILFVPTDLEMDARVPIDRHDNTGMYGVFCQDIQDEDWMYTAIIDSAAGFYSIIKVDILGMGPVTDPPWQPLAKPNFDGETNRIGVTCTDTTLALTVNGVKEAEVGDLAWSTTGHGKMGIFVVANDQTGPEGFRILFDNVNIWK